MPFANCNDNVQNIPRNKTSGPIHIIDPKCKEGYKLVNGRCRQVLVCK